jgi:hypothetical protein
LKQARPVTASCWMRISDPHDSQLINTRYSKYDNR